MQSGILLSYFSIKLNPDLYLYIKGKKLHSSSLKVENSSNSSSKKALLPHRVSRAFTMYYTM